MRSYDDAFLRQLHQSVAPSIVQLAVFNAKSTQIPCHLGTGLVLCVTPNYIGVITSISCDPKDGFRVVVRFGDQEDLETEVVRTSSLLSALVVRGCNVQAIPCIPTSFHEGDLPEADVVFCIGCFSIVKEQIMTAGIIRYPSILDDNSWIFLFCTVTFVAFHSPCIIFCFSLCLKCL